MVLGIQCGTLIWGVLTSLGVTALLTASHLAYEVLRWAGAAYLMWMGGGLLWTSWRRLGGRARPKVRTGLTPAAGPRAADDTVLGGWRQGSATNLLNPEDGCLLRRGPPAVHPSRRAPPRNGPAPDRCSHSSGRPLVLRADRLRARAPWPPPTAFRTPASSTGVTGAAITVFGLRPRTRRLNSTETRPAHRLAHPKSETPPRRSLPTGVESVGLRQRTACRPTPRSRWRVAEAAVSATHGHGFGPEQKAPVIGRSMEDAAEAMAGYCGRPGAAAELAAELLEGVREVLARGAEVRPGAAELVRALRALAAEPKKAGAPAHL
ncbi:LysE family transporter [Streptomyces sp. L7]